MTTATATSSKSYQWVSLRLLSQHLAIGLFRLATSFVWLLLAVVTPIMTTLLTAIALVGIGLVLFFGVLVKAPSFQTSAVLIITAASVCAAALLNLFVEWLRPR